MKLFTGWVLAAGLVLGATTAEAQMPGPNRVSDFTGPYVDAPYRGGYYAPPPQQVPPPGYGGHGYGYAPALLPPHEVYTILRENGFSPLGAPQQRGFIYTIAVVDRGGEDGRLVIDARSGRILRFVRAWQNGASYDGATNSAYGPPGPLPPTAASRTGPRPPESVSHVASRSVPVPKPSPLAGKPVAKPAEAAAKPAAEAPSQQAAVTQATPAEAAAAATPATVGQAQVEAKPAPAILPTQDMPKPQGLE